MCDREYLDEEVKAYMGFGPKNNGDFGKMLSLHRPYPMHEKILKNSDE